MKWTNAKLLPNVDELYAFQQGNLGKKRSEQLLTWSYANPLLASAIAATNTVEQSDAKSLALNVKQQLHPLLKVKQSSWNNYLTWTIFLCGLLLLTWFIYPKHDLEKQAASKVLVSRAAVNATYNAPQPAKKVTVTGSTTAKAKKAIPLVEKKSTETTLSPVIAEPIPTNTKAQVAENTKNTIQASTPKTANKLPLKNNAAVSSDKNSTIVLSLQYVQLMQKINPDDAKVHTSSSKQFDPLKRGEVKKSNKTYAAEDLPTFPGGDEAIEDYFRGIIRPTSVAANSVSTKNRSCYVRILVNAHGKVKETEIIGAPPKAIAEPLEKGLKNLPDFIPGKGNSVEYMLSLSY